MVHRAPRPDASLKKRIDEAAIVIDSLPIRGAGAGRLNARPGNGKTVALLIDALGQGDVLRIAVILIAGNIPGHASPNFPRCVRKSVPYGFAFAIFIPCAFNLI